jgi:hypothetical protein
VFQKVATPCPEPTRRQEKIEMGLAPENHSDTLDEIADAALLEINDLIHADTFLSGVKLTEVVTRKLRDAYEAGERQLKQFIGGEPCRFEFTNSVGADLTSPQHTTSNIMNYAGVELTPQQFHFATGEKNPLKLDAEYRRYRVDARSAEQEQIDLAQQRKLRWEFSKIDLAQPRVENAVHISVTGEGDPAKIAAVVDRLRVHPMDDRFIKHRDEAIDPSGAWKDAPEWATKIGTLDELTVYYGKPAFYAHERWWAVERCGTHMASTPVTESLALDVKVISEKSQTDSPKEIDRDTLYRDLMVFRTAILKTRDFFRPHRNEGMITNLVEQLADIARKHCFELGAKKPEAGFAAAPGDE